MTDIINLSILSQDDYRRIHAASSKDLKRQTLLSALCIRQIDEEDELLKSIVIDYCLEAIIFASNQGFAWEKVEKAAKFALNLLQESCCKGIPAESAIDVFKSKLRDISNDFFVDEVKKLIDYNLSHLFRHYNLYLYCMTNEQEVDLCEENREIEGPIMPDPLVKGTEIEKWKYDQKMKEIELEENKLKTQRVEKLQQKVNLIEENKTETVQKLEEVCENVEGDDLPKILEILTKLHVEYMESEIQNSLEESKDKVDFTIRRGLVSKPNSEKVRATSRSRSRKGR